MKTTSSLVLCSLYCACSTVAALDFSRAGPVAAVADGKVSVGKQTVLLPDGDWTYISYVKGEVSTQATAMRATTHTGYFANVQGKRLKMALVVELPENTMPAQSWNNEPCRDDGNVLKSTVDSTFRFPECILVNRRTALHGSPSGTFYPPAKQWLEANLTEFPGPIYDIFYSLYSANGHGRIRVFVPTAAFPDPEGVSAWAKTFPATFRPLIEGRSVEARLPALP